MSTPSTIALPDAGIPASALAASVCRISWGAIAAGGSPRMRLRRTFRAAPRKATPRFAAW